MGNRPAKFISAVIASIIAGSLSAESQSVPGGASDCLASPKGAAPQGQHWFYRIERDSKRKCWYLRGADAKTTRTTQVADAEAPAPTADTPAPRPVQDARAEFVQQQHPAPVRNVTEAPAAPTAAATPPQPAASDNGDQATVETPWPDPSSVVAPAARPVPMPPPKLADARPVSKPRPTATASTSTLTPASADISSDKPTGSLQMLLLVIGGALALAGLLASVVYRVAGSRLRVGTSESGRRVNWDRHEPSDDSRAPWLALATANLARRAQPPRPVDFDLARPAAARIDDVNEETAVSDTQAEPIDAEINASEHAQILLPEEPEIALAADAVETPLASDEAPTEDAGHGDAGAVDIDAITAVLERLAKQGPQLAEPNPEADLADFVRSRLARSAARA